MKNIYHLIKKNLKLLIRAKSSALIVILAPLLLILLIGFSYNYSETGLNIGVQATSFTAEIDSFILTLQQEDYKIIKYEKTDDCIEDIKLGLVHTCLSLPENFQIQDNSQKQITFYIDQTKVNLVNLITQSLSTQFNLKSRELSQELSGNILTKLAATKTQIDSDLGQITTAKTNSETAATQTTAINTELGALDLSVGNATYNTSLVDEFKTDTTDKIDDGLDTLAAARSTISSSNLNSSDKSAILADLDSTKEQLEELSTNLESDTNQTDFKDISSLVSNLKTDVDLIKGKLQAVSSKVTSANNQLSSINSVLATSISSLDSVHTSLTGIQTNLADQKVTAAATVAAPLITNIEKISPEKTNLNYLFPSLMILVVMFISILLGTTLVMMEKHNPAYFRNFIVPVKKFTFVFSTYLTNVLLILVQIVIIFGISLAFLPNTWGQLPLTALILFVVASVFTLLGMLVGYLFTSEDTGTLASISLGALFLLVSGVILPLESMPSYIRNITSFNPFVLGEKLIREVFLFNSPFLPMINDFLILLGYVIVLFIIILIIDALGSKHFVTKMLYKHHKHLREKKEKAKKLKITPLSKH